MNAPARIAAVAEDIEALTVAEGYTDRLALRAAALARADCGVSVPDADAQLLLCNALKLAADDLAASGEIALEYIGDLFTVYRTGMSHTGFAASDYLANRIHKDTHAND